MLTSQRHYNTTTNNTSTTGYAPEDTSKPRVTGFAGVFRFGGFGVPFGRDEGVPLMHPRTEPARQKQCAQYIKQEKDEGGTVVDKGTYQSSHMATVKTVVTTETILRKKQRKKCSVDIPRAER